MEDSEPLTIEETPVEEISNDDLTISDIDEDSLSEDILEEAEEPLNETILYQSVNALRYSDLLIVGGTSLNVYPAAGLIYEFGGEHKILINKERTPLDSFFDEVIEEDIGDSLEYLLF